MTATDTLQLLLEVSSSFNARRNCAAVRRQPACGNLGGKTLHYVLLLQKETIENICMSSCICIKPFVRDVMLTAILSVLHSVPLRGRHHGFQPRLCFAGTGVAKLDCNLWQVLSAEFMQDLLSQRCLDDATARALPKHDQNILSAFYSF